MLARQHKRLPAADGEGVELIGHRRALDEAMHLRNRKGSVGFGVAGQRIGANVGGINRLDHRREVGEHALSKRPWTRVLPHWAAGLAYPAPQVFEALTTRQRGCGGRHRTERRDLFAALALDQDRLFVAGAIAHPGRVAGVDERVSGGSRIVEHAVEDLDFGDGRAAECGQPRHSLGNLTRHLPGIQP